MIKLEFENGNTIEVKQMHPIKNRFVLILNEDDEIFNCEPEDVAIVLSDVRTITCVATSFKAFTDVGQ